MKKIFIFGASGLTGIHVVREAFNAGYEVTVIIDDPDNYVFNNTLIKIIKGDAFHPETFENALNGKDVVISCLGLNHQTTDVLYSKGIKNIIYAMQKARMKRLICISLQEIEVAKGTSISTIKNFKNIFQSMFQRCYPDILMLESMMLESNLNWTLIHPQKLRNGLKTGCYRTSINVKLANPTSLTRSDLADFIIYYMDDEKFFQSKVEISY
jgi:putative NADH-flavin reductase